jgi:uncharacterized membrane protein
VKTLFLAVVDIHSCGYMEDANTKTINCVVWGDDEDDARAIIEKEYTKDESYSYYQMVTSMTLTPALGSPV